MRRQLYYSNNGEDFSAIGESFNAKVGLFAVTSQETGLHGYADFDWFRIEPISILDQKMGQ